jgi:molybdate transport system substrate-binding protein
VRALLTKVREGELDAGLVYATDVASDALVTGVDVPEEYNVLVSYPIAVISTSANPEAAKGFLEFALSGAGRAVLSSHGFSIP